MTSKRLLDKSLTGIRLGGAASTPTVNGTYAGNTTGHGETVTAMDCGVILTCKKTSSPGRIFSPVLDDSTLREHSKDSLVNGVGLKSGREKHLDLKKVGVLLSLVLCMCCNNFIFSCNRVRNTLFAWNTASCLFSSCARAMVFS